MRKIFSYVCYQISTETDIRHLQNKTDNLQ